MFRKHLHLDGLVVAQDEERFQRVREETLGDHMHLSDAKQLV